jgi:hypothetical protein
VLRKTSRSPVKFRVALLAATALAITACGGGGDDSDDAGPDRADEGAGVGLAQYPGELADAPPQYGGSVTFGIEAATQNGWCIPEAQLAISGIQVARAVYDTLTVPDGEGGFQPHLAESIGANDDFTEWTLELREDIQFHNGEELDAELVAYNLDIARGAVEAPYSPVLIPIALKDIAEVRAEGDLTVVIEGDRITAILPLPDESEWGRLHVMFATTRGTVRRNQLSDFVDVKRNGKIAMKFDEEGDAILAVETCTENDDVLLTADSGQCIRFPVTDVRVFASRNSTGVRGINLGKGEKVISMAILTHVEATPAERASYLKQAVAERRASGVEEEDISLTNEEVSEEAYLSPERYEELKQAEQFVLTVSEKGSGKRSSSYDFRVIGRGGKGIRATDVSKTGEIGPLVAAFPVAHDDQIMLVTDRGKVIRVPVGGIRIASRATKGVKIFTTSDDERVVSVEHIPDVQSDEVEENGEAETQTPPDLGPDGVNSEN